jgi:thiamine biosynthesis lipoprotein
MSSEFGLLVAAILCGACEQSVDREQELFAFGTIITVRAYQTNDEQFSNAIVALEQRYSVVDVDWYPWPRSDSLPKGGLIEVNQAIANGRTILVEPSLATLIRRASAFEQQSDGLFNPATGQLTRLWGFDDLATKPESLPDPAKIQALLDAGLHTRSLQWQGDSLRSASRDIALDLGGIAKGAILAFSVDILLEHGIQNAIVDIGGDLTVVGRVNGRAARIGIRSPSGSGVAGMLAVNDGETVATSGDYERFFEIDGRRYQHILDPRTGYPVEHTASVTVVHTDPLLADAAATALLVGGPMEFDEICRKLAISDALLIDSSGDVRLTPTMRKRVKWAN